MTDYSAKHREVRAELARRKLCNFTTWTKPDYKINPADLIVFPYLDRLIAGEITRLMLFMPPRHGKSEKVSRRLPAFFLGKNPDAEVLIASYAADLAERMNRDVQRIIDSPAYAELFPDTRLSDPGSRSGSGKAIRTDKLFEIVGHRGSLRAAGFQGGMTGMGGDLVVIDDPFKNFEESHSPTIREKVWEEYCATVWTRQARHARILLTMTRWHEDDLAGRLQALMAEDPEADQWVVVRLPALADDDLHPEDSRSKGEALWPERFDKDWLAGARATLGSYLFTGMYQQCPTEEGGNHFKAAWFRRKWKDAGAFWLVEDAAGNWERYEKNDCTCYVTADPAASEKQTADFTAFGAWVVTPHNDLLLVDVVRERLGIDCIVPKLLEMCTRKEYKPGWVVFEDTGFQASLRSAARRVKGLPPIRGITHEGKWKLVRATPAIILAESGKIILPAEPKPWVKPYLDELTRFTGLEDKHDDQVDVTAYAVWQMPRAGKAKEDEREPDAPHVAYRPGHESHAASRGLWGRK